MGQDRSPAASPRPKPTTRTPGRWNEVTVTGNDLSPEASTSVPWLSPEEFEEFVHRATEGTGFKFEHRLPRRPDLVLGERDIGLDRVATRNRLLIGLALALVGILIVAVGFLYLLPTSGAFGPNLLTEIAGTAATMAGFLTAAQSRWESDLLRVRLDPSTTRVHGRTPSVEGERPTLSVRVFTGRVTSSSLMGQGSAGTIRSLQKVLPAAAPPGEASEIATRLAELVRNRTPSAVAMPPLRSSLHQRWAGRRASRLVPLASEAGRREWFDNPRWIVYLRVVTMMVPMMLLSFGPLILFLPWNYERVDFLPGGPSTQSLPAEPWSPTGATNGQIWWYTYDPATYTEVNNVPVVVALCPIGIDTILPSACRSVTEGSLSPLTQGDLSITISAGWHVVANATVSEICSGCHTSVRFSSPDVALGLALTITGIGVLTTCVLLWVRTLRRVRSAWPGQDPPV